jgi:hypothetical protein
MLGKPVLWVYVSSWLAFLCVLHFLGGFMKPQGSFGRVLVVLFLV